jgi:ribosome biogenesis GTPase
VTRDLLRLPSGAALIDTPGLRLVGTWDGAGAAFADVEVLAERCRFADCNHDGEPGCAVAEAVDPDRLRSWHRLRREQARLDDRRAADERDRRLTTHYRRTQRAAARWKGRPPG